MTDVPLIITCAVVGAELTRNEYQFLPVTPDEIASSAHEAVLFGASIIHLHVRDKDGKPTQSVDVFKDVTRKIKDRCDAIIQYSTGGAVGTPVNERCAPLRLKPEMASLTMGTMNFGNDIFENSKETITAIAGEIKKYKIMPELEIFDYGMLENALRCTEKGRLPRRFHIDFVLGVPGGMSGTVENLLYLVRRLPENQSWSVAGIGKYQLPLAMHAIAMGGHVRVGIEDNIYYNKKELARSNAQFVDRIARISREAGRPVSSAREARKILGL